MNCWTQSKKHISLNISDFIFYIFVGVTLNSVRSYSAFFIQLFINTYFPLRKHKEKEVIL